MFGQQSNQPANDQIPGQSITAENWQHPGSPIDSIPTEISPIAPAALDAVVQPEAPVLGNPANDLIDIKQQALSQLSPLIDHLDQSPEEKFKTTMMMIQASDDQTLVKVAYEAAMKIEDEKVRAQALLDIVNEINYFTAHHPEA